MCYAVRILVNLPWPVIPRKACEVCSNPFALDVPISSTLLLFMVYYDGRIHVTKIPLKCLLCSRYYTAYTVYLLWIEWVVG